ncbi:MAG: glucoamylase family protein, partial [Planctomycetota bacterium]
SEMLPGWNRNLTGTSATGFSIYNYIVGVERGYITRQQGAQRLLKMTEFLLNKVKTFWGVYPHWLNGETGEIIPMSPGNDGSDLLETSFMVMGLIGAREYFDGNTATEQQLRDNVNKIWGNVDWTSHAAVRPDGMKAFHWVWSPSTKGFYPNLYCSGFSENHMTYLLALSSPTHSVSDDYYHQGWQSADFINEKPFHGAEPTFTWGYRISLFPAHFAYMALDPKQVSYKGKTYYHYLYNWCLAQYRYIPTRKDDFKGYEHPLWGLSAGCSPVPGNFGAHAPSDAWEHSKNADNGTLTPSASISSIVYLPDEAKAAMVEMFTKHGDRLWGPFGPYDAFNLTKDWVAEDYIAINVAPVAPMIENHLTGKCWETFMKAPEIQKTVNRLRKNNNKNNN